MSCLDDLVGVRGCGEETALVYVNDLTGISVANFDNAINTEQRAALPALQSIINIAGTEIQQTVREHLETKYSLKTFIENDVAGYYYDDKQTVAAQTGYYTGIQVKIDKTPYLTFYIGTVNLMVNTTGNVAVKVYDLIQGKLLDTITVAAVAGNIVSVNIDKGYATNKQRLNLFIGYESTFAGYKTSIHKNNGTVGEWCDTCFGSNGSHIYFRNAKLSTAAQAINQNVESADGAGLSIGYSLQCSFDEYLCNIKNKLAFPMLYKAGELIMREMKYSKRLTGIVTVFKQDHDELRSEYIAEYQTRMNELMRNLEMPDSLCFSCNKSVRTEVNLP